MAGAEVSPKGSTFHRQNPDRVTNAAFSLDLHEEVGSLEVGKKMDAIVLAGDDPACKSSSLPSQSEHAFAHAMIPLSGTQSMLQPTAAAGASSVLSSVRPARTSPRLEFSC